MFDSRIRALHGPGCDTALGGSTLSDHSDPCSRRSSPAAWPAARR